ncbi:egg cell-secreted protein 1.4-like [Lathyrus oleraceus]|uniref:egg cell-secreted protein 1.4-like n=1 Tax=Pisum sativum TaxID=3888 RepID=UPI001FC5BC80|nr:egg cell-secreted protein 1.4-like [Pisum sativum]
MSSFLKLFVILSLSAIGAARSLTATTTKILPTRLESFAGAGTNNKCWETMFELQHCTGEIVEFFINGETQLGSGCCDALLTIANECWPNMLTSLGLTQEEAGILHGFCNGAASVTKPNPPSVTANANAPTPNNYYY